MKHVQDTHKPSPRPAATSVQKTVGSTASVAQRQENRTGLPDNLKAGIENLSGHSMDDVKVHYNSSQPAQLQAHAYAQGTNIHIAPGQGKHLPHEAWHVVQQKQGRVKPTSMSENNIQTNGEVIQGVFSQYQIQLPESELYRLNKLEINDAPNLEEIEDFVNKLDRTKHMHFYDSVSEWMHENSAKKSIPDPFNEKLMNTLWQCGSCKLGTTSFELGHITDWKKELKKAGVTNMYDAVVVYNNLLNLKAECPKCNSSHDWEEDEEGHFKDHMTQQDFIENRGNDTIKNAKQNHKEYMKTYDNTIEDEYGGDFIDNSLRDNEALFSSIYLIETGGANRFGHFGNTRISFTGMDHSLFTHLKIVQIEDTEDKNLKIGSLFYLDESKSKRM